jgi:hypothetical protein
MSVKVPFATQSYQSRSLPLSAQRLVNLFAEAAPKDATTQVVLFGTPGLTLWATIGSGPIRALHVMGTVLYAVSGDQVYSVNSAGTGTLLGQLAGTERTGSQVFAADNGTQLVLINGDGKGTVYDADAATLSPITDSDFPRASSVSYVDGYFVFTRPNTGQWFISDLLSITAKSGCSARNPPKSGATPATQTFRLKEFPGPFWRRAVRRPAAWRGPTTACSGWPTMA